MTKNTLSLLLALACCTLIGCGGGDYARLLERQQSQLDENARTIATLTERVETSEARADEIRDAALSGETPDTSGGDTGAVATAPVASVAPIMGAPLMTPVGTTTTGMPGVVQMCDGVDGAGMLTSGMLTSSMAFSPGSETWSAGDLDGMTYAVTNGSIFDIALAIDGRVVHVFTGGTPTMVSDTSGMCAMPAIPRRPALGQFRTFVIPLVDNADRSEHEVQFFCYRAAGGRLPTAPAFRGSFRFLMAGGRNVLFENATCGQPGTP